MVVDATRREGFLATLYQRGVTFEEAVRAPEFMYLQFWRKDKKRVNTVDALLTFQEGYMLGGSPDAKIEIIERGINQRLGVKTLIRRFERREDPGSSIRASSISAISSSCVSFSRRQS